MIAGFMFNWLMASYSMFLYIFILLLMCDLYMYDAPLHCRKPMLRESCHMHGPNDSSLRTATLVSCAMRQVMRVKDIYNIALVQGFLRLHRCVVHPVCKLTAINSPLSGHVSILHTKIA